MSVSTSFAQPAPVSPVLGLRGFQVELNSASFTAADWDALAATGAKLVRAPVVLDYTDGTKVALQWRAGSTPTEMAVTVAACAARGIKLVIGVFVADVDIQASAFWSTSSVRTSYVTRMGELATAFAGNTTVAAIDPLNEPYPSGADFRAGQRTLIDVAKLARDAIRAADSTRWLVFQPNPNSRAMAWEWDHLYTDTWLFDRVIWSPHMYEMTRVTHQGVPGFPPEVLSYPATIPGTDYPYGPLRYSDAAYTMDRAFMASVLAPIRAFEIAKRVPILIGEFSCVRWAPNPQDWITDVAGMFNAYGWSWAFHSFRGYEGWDMEQQWSTTRTAVARNAAASPAWKAVVSAIGG